MRRVLWIALPLAAVAGLAALLAGRQSPAEAAGAVAEGRAGAPKLPVSRVVLFNSGVAYFQREGEVDGAANVELSFPAGQVNDLIKSITVSDAGGGKPQPLRYDSQEPLEQTLRSFAIDLSANPGYGDILNQARGEAVEVGLEPAVIAGGGGLGGPPTVSGTVVGMEARQKAGPAGTVPVEEEFLTLSTKEGVQSVPLAGVRRVKFQNAALDAEFKRALDVLARGHDSARKGVRVGFAGKGRRKVSLGYVVENPIWKTTYRLDLDAKKAGLQGWAAIENVTDEDWSNVNMTLVSSRPISFRMDLYQPLYVPRPLVEPDLFAMLRPPAYNGPLEVMPGGNALAAMNDSDPLATGQGQLAGASGNGQQPFAGAGSTNLGFGGGAAGFGGGFGGGVIAGQAGNMGFGGQGGFQGQFGIQGNNRYRNPMSGNAALPQGKLSYEELQNRRNTNNDRGANPAKAEPKPSDGERDLARRMGEQIAAGDVAAVAAANEGLPGAMRHEIEGGVSLARKQSALIPLPEVPVAVAHLSIYNASVQAAHPLLGLRVKNNSEQALMQGPLAVHDGGTFAGEARLPDLQPGEERLVSYAIDQATEVKTETTARPGPTLLTRLDGETLAVGYKLRQVTRYVVRNRSARVRDLLIEHPIKADWKLVTPTEAKEKTRDVYRLTVQAKANDTTIFEVAEEQARTEGVRLTRLTGVAGFRTGFGFDAWTEETPVAEPDVTLAVGGDKLSVRSRGRVQRTYQFQATGTGDRTLILEHPIRDGRQLVTADKAVKSERVGAAMRYELALPEKGKATFRVTEESQSPEARVVALTREGAPPRAGTDDPPVARFRTGLGFEAWTASAPEAVRLTAARVAAGTLHFAEQQRVTVTYTVRNDSTADRTFQVEHAIPDGWRLENAPAPEGKATLPLAVPAGKTASVGFVELRVTPKAESLAPAPEVPLTAVRDAADTKPAVKAAVAQALELSKRLATLTAQSSEGEAERERIVGEQARIRPTLEKLPADSALFKRYLEKIGTLESELEKVQASLKATASDLKDTRVRQAAFLKETKAE